MSWLGVAIGALLLLFGRQAFWLFVGAAGFVAGVAAARAFLGPQPDWVVLVIGLVAGLGGAVLAVVLERVAVGIGGFLIGGYLLATLVLALGWMGGGMVMLAWLVGGVIGAVVVSLLLDPALIVLSALAGAALVTESLGASAAAAPWVFVAALALGLVVQLAQLRPAG